MGPVKYWYCGGNVWRNSSFLPPAYIVWGKVMFWHESVCLSTLAEGRVPHLRSRGIPHPRSGQGGTPCQVWLGGTPSQVWTGGYPIQGLDRRGTWSTLDQVRMGYPLTPRPGTRSTPDQVRMGYPYPPRPGMGYPPDLGQGTPTPQGPEMVYPWDLGWVPPQTWDGVPPQHSEHLLRGGQYASCVHAGGLSCHVHLFTQRVSM